MNTTMDNNTFFEVDYSYQTELYKLYNCCSSNKFKFLNEEVAKNIFSILSDRVFGEFLSDINPDKGLFCWPHIIENERTGLKIKSGFKLWSTINKDKLPFFSIWENDNFDDYDYKIQFLALSRDGTYKNIEKIFALGFISKENLIEIYKNFKPSLKCKYPCFTINELSPISEFINLKEENKEKETPKIARGEIENITKNIQNEIEVIENSMELNPPEILSKTIQQNYIEEAKIFSRKFSEKIYDSENKEKEKLYLNTLQGKIAEMAVYDFLKDENLVDEKDWGRMLKILSGNYDFGDFILPNNKIIDVKSTTNFNKDNPYFNLPTHNLDKNINYFVFSVVKNGISIKTFNSPFNKPVCKVDLYGFIDKYKLKSLINENKITEVSIGPEISFYSIHWKYLKPITEIYKP